MKVAVYPGSFDPITNGHLDILQRSLKIFDKVIVLIAVNPTKKSHFSLEERIAMIQESVKGLGNIEVASTEGLTLTYAKKVGAVALIRGLRAVTDYEYEFQLSAANSFIDNTIDMVFFMAKKENTFISSSSINQLQSNGVDISKLVPTPVVEAYKNKK